MWYHSFSQTKIFHTSSMVTSSSQNEPISTKTPTISTEISPQNQHVPTSTLFLLSNICNLVPLCLDSTNYVLWKYQVSSILKAHSFFDHIDDSLPCPLKFLFSTAVRITPEINLEYLQWLSRDQVLITLINTTLSPSSFVHVVGSTSSKSL